MTLDEYQREAMCFAAPACKGLANAALGLAGEAGEFATLAKRALFHGRGFDHRRAVEELGDALWYLALACDVLCVPLSEVAAQNTAKLRARHEGEATP
jgi:NTP pyrophosphatase (non-canonical NTP hydrolase)